MKRTSILMTSVAASLMLSGAAKPQTASSATPTQEEDWKTNPRVIQAADTIVLSLKGKDSLTALSVKDIRALYPKMQPSVVDLALKRLVWQGRVKRKGEEGKDSLYRYYYYQSHGGGG